MKGDILLNGHFPADYLRRERKRDRLEDQKNLPLNPIVGWSIALLVSAGLCGASGVAVSSLVSVVLSSPPFKGGAPLLNSLRRRSNA